MVYDGLLDSAIIGLFRSCSFEKDRLMSISTIHHMINRPGILNAQLPATRHRAHCFGKLSIQPGARLCRPRPAAAAPKTHSARADLCDFQAPRLVEDDK